MMPTHTALKDFTGQPLTRQILLELLRDYKRPYDKINEWVQQQVLIPVKRGVFVAGAASDSQAPEPFLLANHLLGPSYVSLETALSYWQLIPEQVFETSSVTIARSKTYSTPVGRFSYTRLPLPYYSFGQQSVTVSPNQVALIASAEKALCDKIITTSGLIFRSSVQLLNWLTEDMRIEKSSLRNLNLRSIQSWLNDAPKQQSLQLLLKTLEDI